MSETENERSYLRDVIDRAEAIMDCGAGTLAELSLFLFPKVDRRQANTRVAEWIRARSRNPNGEMALRIQDWLAAKTLEISKAGKKASNDYAAALRKVQQKQKEKTT